MKHGNDKNISKSPQLENNQEDESDSNHNSEPNEGESFKLIVFPFSI